MWILSRAMAYCPRWFVDPSARGEIWVPISVNPRDIWGKQRGRTSIMAPILPHSEPAWLGTGVIVVPNAEGRPAIEKWRRGQSGESQVCLVAVTREADSQVCCLPVDVRVPYRFIQVEVDVACSP